jgi:hypothetical protein
MPQVSLYLDETTLRRIELAATTEGVSLSKYVARKLRSSMEDEWPAHFGDLFGAIDDGTFGVDPVSVGDVPREQL